MISCHAASSSGGAPVRGGGPPRARCAVCGTSYDRDAWTALPIMQELSASRVRAHLSVPAEWSIEVRTCRCGSQLARRTTP